MPQATAAWSATRRRGGRRTRSPAASSRRTSPPTLSCCSSPSPHEVVLMSPTPLRVLVAGGGVAALEAVLALRALAGDRVAIELLAPSDDFVQRQSSVLSPFSGEPAPRVPLD